MSKRSRESLVTRPLPSAKVPWLMILCLIACIVLVYMGFLREPDKLLGPSLAKNEYLPLMTAPPPAPAQPAIVYGPPAPTASRITPPKTKAAAVPDATPPETAVPAAPETTAPDTTAPAKPHLPKAPGKAPQPALGKLPDNAPPDTPSTDTDSAAPGQ